MVLGLLDIHMQKNEAGSLPHTIHKTNSKWIRDFNVKAKTKKFSEEYIGINLCDCNLGDSFLDIIPKEQTKDRYSGL